MGRARLEVVVRAVSQFLNVDGRGRRRHGCQWRSRNARLKGPSSPKNSECGGECAAAVARWGQGSPERRRRGGSRIREVRAGGRRSDCKNGKREYSVSLHDYEMRVCPILVVTLEAAERVVYGGGGKKGAETGPMMRSERCV
jgi:hypothetical protein